MPLLIRSKLIKHVELCRCPPIGQSLDYAFHIVVILCASYKVLCYIHSDANCATPWVLYSQLMCYAVPLCAVLSVFVIMCAVLSYCVLCYIYVSAVLC
jgi:hypothetical protein